MNLYLQLSAKRIYFLFPCILLCSMLKRVNCWKIGRVICLDVFETFIFTAAGKIYSWLTS